MTMELEWFELGRLTIRAPVTAGTNLLLCTQCVAYSRRLLGASEPRARFWGGFFAATAAATLAGVFKHGFRHELSESALWCVLWTSSLAGGLATYCAQRATLVSYAPPRLAHALEGVARAQLGLFLGANGVLGPEMPLLVANAAVGLLPVIFVEAAALRRGHRSGGWVACGLIVSIGSGSAYMLSLSLDPWLNHIDVAHVLMAVSFLLIVRGSFDYVAARSDYVLPDGRLRRSAHGGGTRPRASWEHANKEGRHRPGIFTATEGAD